MVAYFTSVEIIKERTIESHERWLSWLVCRAAVLTDTCIKVSNLPLRATMQ
jgi:hypothetical protein